MGADVEVDCREGTNEHAVHLAGRPGNTNTSSNPRHVNTHPAVKVCRWISWNYKIIWTMCRSPQDFLFLTRPKILTVKCCCWVKFWSRVGMLLPNKLVRPQYIQVKLYEGISKWRSGKTWHDSLQLAKLDHLIHSFWINCKKIDYNKTAVIKHKVIILPHLWFLRWFQYISFMKHIYERKV